MEKVKAVRPEAKVRGYSEQDLPVVAIANVRKSNTGKSINFDRPTEKDFSNGKIEMSYASADQAAGAWSWFVDANNKEVEVGKECFINPPKMFGLKGGRGIYA